MHKNKTRNNKSALTCILEWLYEMGLDENFEEMGKENLAMTLRKFYATVIQRNKDGSEGKHYAKQSLINIRSALNHHLQNPSFNRTWDLIHDSEFKPANKVFTGKLKNIKTNS